MNKRMLLICLLALSASAQDTTQEAVLVTLQGTLSSNGKPITEASFNFAPAASRTAVEVNSKGKFTVKGVVSRTYALSIEAVGYAPIHQTVEISAGGVGNLGNLKLEALKTAKMSVVVAPREAFKGVAAQHVELRHNGCANVRVQDDSGCRLEFCVEQTGPNLLIRSDSYQGHFSPLGKLSLAEAVDGLPKGTYVRGDNLARIDHHHDDDLRGHRRATDR